MKNTKEIIQQNLIALRKQNGLTQLELATKINYSDKAISRWEKGEVMPSVDILESLANVYGVQIAYFFEEHQDEVSKEINLKTKNIYVAITLSMVLVVWTIAVILFFMLKEYQGKYYFMIFVWSVPATVYAIRFNIFRWFQDKYYILINTLCLWSTFVAIYFQWINLNIWQIFLMGIPMQLLIILNFYVKKIKKSNPNIKIKQFFK